jgi:hypothetical protein
MRRFRYSEIAMEQHDVTEAAESEPFLLHESSRAYLDGDPHGIRDRFQFRRDALDYIAMAFAIAGGLLLAVKIMQLTRGVGDGDEMHATVSAMGLAVLLIVGGTYYVTSRQRVAAARRRMVDDGQVLNGTVLECTARHETTAEAALGEVSRSYVVAVDYRFTAPSGDTIIDRDEHNRPDLRRTELPAAGTPVRVLYLDEGTHALL